MFVYRRVSIPSVCSLEHLAAGLVLVVNGGKYSSSMEHWASGCLLGHCQKNGLNGRPSCGERQGVIKKAILA